MKKIKLMLTVMALSAGIVGIAFGSEQTRSKSESSLRPLPPTPAKTQSLSSLPSTKEATEAQKQQKETEEASASKFQAAKKQAGETVDKIGEQVGSAKKAVGEGLESAKESVTEGAKTVKTQLGKGIDAIKKKLGFGAPKEEAAKPLESNKYETAFEQAGKIRAAQQAAGAQGSRVFQKVAAQLDQAKLNAETQVAVSNALSSIRNLKTFTIQDTAAFKFVKNALTSIKKSVDNKLTEVAKRIDDFKGDNPVKNALLKLKGQTNEASLDAAEKNLKNLRESDETDMTTIIKAHTENRKALATLERCPASTTMSVKDITDKKIALNTSYSDVSKNVKDAITKLEQQNTPEAQEQIKQLKSAVTEFGKANLPPETRLSKANTQLRSLGRAITNHAETFKASITNLLPKSARSSVAAGDISAAADAAAKAAKSANRVKLERALDTLKNVVGSLKDKITDLPEEVHNKANDLALMAVRKYLNLRSEVAGANTDRTEAQKDKNEVKVENTIAGSKSETTPE